MTSRASKHIRVTVFTALLIGVLSGSFRAGADVGSVDAGVRLEASSDATLPPLPDVPRLDVPPPTAEEVQDLDSKLNDLFSEESDTREAAIGELVEARAKMVSSIHARLSQIADRSDKERMKRILGDARRQVGSASAKQNTGGDNDTDTLSFLLHSGKLKEQATRDCVNLLALLRMLTAISTVESARELIYAYSRFGEFIRVEVQHRLADIKDRSIAALIEARRHPAEKISRWAALRLDQMGKAIPGETVRTNDFDALGDILRAYGRVRDPDAARLIISFANSERGQLRLAARQAIALLGPVGMWQLRDAYEDVVGKKPRRDWTWERTARELFGEFDRLRLSRVYGTFVEGMQHLEKGDLVAMGKAFDLVLAKDPLFEKRSQMADGYFKLASSLAPKDPRAASLAAIRAERLSTDPHEKDRARSLILTMRAQDSERRGALDIDRLERAVQLDPNNRMASTRLAAAKRAGLAQTQGATFRWVASAAIAVAGLLAVVFVLLRRQSGEPASKTAAD